MTAFWHDFFADNPVWAHGTWTFDDTLAPPPPEPAESEPKNQPSVHLGRLLQDVLTTLVPFPEARLAVATLLVHYPTPLPGNTT